jgi:anti-sigma regulatory factor (Ser/Thr protein kinase)/biotin operon repressor
MPKKMSLKKLQRDEIIQFILWNIREHPDDIVRLTQEKFGLSRTAILHYAQQLEREKRINIEGVTRNRKYSLIPLHAIHRQYQLQPSLAEDKIWRIEVSSLFHGIKENVINICQYGFTEIFNNALDHSEGTEIDVDVTLWIDRIAMTITDNGVGIFNKIQKKYGLDDPLHAILELSKGKLTTEPETHTGEGIFFASRIFDFFAILSDRLRFGYEEGIDMLMETESNTSGTKVHMGISSISDRTTANVFAKFATEEFGFDKTIVPVRLARYGNENLISRSQAKRLLARLDRFKTVMLDFNGVPQIGRAFADEIFRVFVKAHPGTKVFPVNESNAIKQLIQEVMREKY